MKMMNVAYSTGQENDDEGDDDDIENTKNKKEVSQQIYSKPFLDLIHFRQKTRTPVSGASAILTMGPHLSTHRMALQLPLQMQ